jgi:hypothetical protein
MGLILFLDHQLPLLVEEVVLLVQVRLQIQEILVVLVVVLQDLHHLVVQQQEHHSQELLEQHQHLVGDILEDQQVLPDNTELVVVVLEALGDQDLVLLRVVLVSKSPQHLEIHPL